MFAFRRFLRVYGNKTIKPKRFYSNLQIDRVKKLHQQAVLFQEAGDYDRAEPLLLASLQLAKKNSIDDSSLNLDLAASYQLQLHVLGAAGLEKTLSLYEAGLENARKDSDFDPAQLARHLSNHASVLVIANRHDDALKQLDEAIKCFQTVYGNNSEYEAMSNLNRASILLTKGLNDEAFETATNALSMLAKSIGTNNEYYLNAKNNVAIIQSVKDQIELEKVVVQDVSNGVESIQLPDVNAVVETEKLDDLVKKWELRPAPGRIDPPGVLMDDSFTRRVLANFLKQNDIPSDGRLLTWLEEETTLHGLRSDYGQLDVPEDDPPPAVAGPAAWLSEQDRWTNEQMGRLSRGETIEQPLRVYSAEDLAHKKKVRDHVHSVELRYANKEITLEEAKRLLSETLPDDKPEEQNNKPEEQNNTEDKPNEELQASAVEQTAADETATVDSGVDETDDNSAADENETK